MNKLVRKILPALGVAFVITILSCIASAQTTDVFWTNYFSNNNPTPTTPVPPDAVLRITNPGVVAGSRGSFSFPGAGSLCAMIYVHSSDQQLNECCGCLVTPNGLQTIDVKTQLTANTLTSRVPNNGVIQVISAAINSGASATSGAGPFPLGPPYSTDNSVFCDPSASYTPTPDLRAWVTHIQNKYGTTYPETETESLPAPLSASELGNEQGACNFLVTQGSGQGICDCGAFER